MRLWYRSKFFLQDILQCLKKSQNTRKSIIRKYDLVLDILEIN